MSESTLSSNLVPNLSPEMMEAKRASSSLLDMKFRFTDYDCLGFDLDNTLVKYKIRPLLNLVHSLLMRYLVGKGYPREHLDKSVDYDFIQKGLILDLEKGNLLKISANGSILIAMHGTNALSPEEIEEYYPNFTWDCAAAFAEDPLECWTGPMTKKICTMIDTFDLCVCLIYARLVDSLDDRGLSINFVFSDIVEALVHVFSSERSPEDPGDYYRELFLNPQNYYYRCSEQLKAWLRSLKATGKILFLITGSDYEYANNTASYTLGPDWRSYFDLIITNAKKPGFFTKHRPFLALENFKEVGPIPFEHLRRGEVYAMGNWDETESFFSMMTSRDDLKFVYIGDSLIQDILAPSSLNKCDCVVVSEELDAEKIKKENHPEHSVLISPFWQSFFKVNGEQTIWAKIIKEHAKACVPDLEYVAKLPLDMSYTNDIYDD